MPPVPLSHPTSAIGETGPVSTRRESTLTGRGTSRYPEPTPVVLRVCPDCSGPLARTSGCVTCLTCGWGRCG